MSWMSSVTVVANQPSRRQDARFLRGKTKNQLQLSVGCHSTNDRCHGQAQLAGPVSTLAHPSLPQLLGGASLPPWSSNLKFLVIALQKPLGFLVMKVASAPPTFASQGKTQWSHVSALASELATTTGRGVVASSLVVKFKILLAFEDGFLGEARCWPG
jgi:hypothetical protein